MPDIRETISSCLETSSHYLMGGASAVAAGAGLVMINLATQIFLPSSVAARGVTLFAGLLLDLGTAVYSVMGDRSCSNLALQIATLVVFNGRRAERRGSYGCS